MSGEIIPYDSSQHSNASWLTRLLQSEQEKAGTFHDYQMMDYYMEQQTQAIIRAWRVSFASFVTELEKNNKEAVRRAGALPLGLGDGGSSISVLQPYQPRILIAEKSDQIVHDIMRNTGYGAHWLHTPNEIAVHLDRKQDSRVSGLDNLLGRGSVNTVRGIVHQGNEKTFLQLPYNHGGNSSGAMAHALWAHADRIMTGSSHNHADLSRPDVPTRNPDALPQLFAPTTSFVAEQVTTREVQGDYGSFLGDLCRTPFATMFHMTPKDVISGGRKLAQRLERLGIRPLVMISTALTGDLDRLEQGLGIGLDQFRQKAWEMSQQDREEAPGFLEEAENRVIEVQTFDF